MALVCVVVPTLLDPRYSVYPDTPVASVAAAHASVTLVAVAEATRSEPGADGGVVSTGVVEESSTVIRATIPVPGSVVSHFCSPSLR